MSVRAVASSHCRPVRGLCPARASEGTWPAQVGTWAPGAFGGLLMAGIVVYIWRTIYKHEIALSLVTK
jgi:hypothetical protein